MCPQSSNQQEDLAALTSNSTSCIVNETEPGALRENYNTQSSHLSGMGMRYMNIPNDDNRFSPESVNSQAPIYSLEPSIRSASPSSGLGISPYSNYYTPPTHSHSGYSNGHGNSGSGYYTPNSLFPSITDNIKPPRLGQIHGPSVHRSRNSPALTHISAPYVSRDIYSTLIPASHRSPSELLIRSSPMTGTVHGQSLSPTSTSGGFTNSMSSMNEVPPFEETEIHYNLTTHDGQTIRPEIFTRIDKGFFMADNNWTCYRRNYFSLNCSFNLSSPVTSGNVYLQLPGSPPVRVHAFCMSISAVVDGRDGKPIELVQHTPKRDKGPQDRPARVVLAPRTSTSHGTYDGITGRPGVYDGQSFNPSSNRPATEATFERIQFKNATANNGKRRAAQQYYHLLVELYADVANESSERYIKIASRISAPMVVRGRSPGHYQSDQRGSSNTSSGPGGSGGGSSGTYPASTGLGRNLGDMSMRGGTSSMLPGSSYTVEYDGRAHHYRSALPSSNISIDPTVSHNNSKHIDTGSCFMYCAGTAWGEGGEPRCQPPISDYSISRNKSGYGYELPSLTLGIQDNSGPNNRNCGRWNTSIENKGYFPSSFTQHEMSIT